MSNRTKSLAHRVADDRYFFASALDEFAKSENLQERDLADFLGCEPETLDQLRLCRRPGLEPESFLADTNRIASHFGINAYGIGQIVRRSDALAAMRNAGDRTDGLLMAARDKLEESPDSGLEDKD